MGLIEAAQERRDQEMAATPGIAVDGEWNLDLFIASLLDRGVSDLDRITAEAMRCVPEARWREVLYPCLRGYVGDLVRVERRGGHRMLHDLAPRDGNASEPGPSRIREGFRAILGNLVALDKNVRKPLGECTRDEVLQVVKMHDGLIASNTVRRDFYRSLANAMARRKAERVRDLPQDVILDAHKKAGF